MMHYPALTALALALSAPAVAQDAAPTVAELPSPEPALSPEVRAMIDAAIAAGDRQAAATLMRYARKAAPDAAGEIDAIEQGWKRDIAAGEARAAAERAERLRAASPFQNWKGQIELGASRATGNSDNLGLYGALDLTREGLEWRHRLYARADFQTTNDVTTTDRVLASWQPNYKFGERAYAFGLAQYEHDPRAGYDARYTAGGGLGYGVLAGPRIRLDVEGGPAFRHTDATNGFDDSARLVGRASAAFKWKISPTLNLAQDAALYLEQGDSNATASTALDTTLIGALKARFSYNIQYERDAPPGASALNTQSRATFVYSF